MSNALFPTLAGIKWGRTKSPSWSTAIKSTVSGREQRVANYSTPIWQFKLQYAYLRAGAQQELESLVGFFNARQGSFDSFLYKDPYDFLVTAQPFGVGDGARTVFQLVRATGGFSEPVVAVFGITTVLVNFAVPATGVVVDQFTGQVTFNVPPPAGAVLSWSGNFYYRCRFLQDILEVENFMKDLWLAKKVEFISVK